jgi:hypothetical protein
LNNVFFILIANQLYLSSALQISNSFIINSNMDVSDALRMLLLIILSLGGIIIWYFIKNVLSENGYKTSEFRNHFSDIINVIDLINKTNDHAKKRSYKMLFWSLVIMLLAFIGTALTFIGNSQKIQCKFFEDYVSREFDGMVTEKYLDKSNHSYPTLMIVTKVDTIKDVELSNFNIGLYDSIAIGDIVRKTQGDSVAYLTRKDKTIEFLAKKNYFCQP